MNLKPTAREIIEKIISGEIKTREKLRSVKAGISRQYRLEKLIRNSDILKYAKKSEKDKLSILVKKPIRTISGVAIVAVMSKPYDCPGKCIYCPTSDAPKSYTGKEPAARRAARYNYDPYLQTKNRLKQLNAVGHLTNKTELIVMGGTFPSFSGKYQRTFIKRCFDAMNHVESGTLKQAQKINETAKIRNVALTIETRPDYAKKEHINKMLELGATRVELGVQTLSDEIYRKVSRGHTVNDVIKSTKFLKDSALKVCYHYMPGLLVSEKEDLKLFKKMFSEPKFRPDMLKIYPTLVIKGTKLYEMWKRGEYTPLTNENAAELISKMKSFVPNYCRIMRVQRDIPADNIEAGVTASNLRELAHTKMQELNLKCRCIRCREAGHKFYKQKITPKNTELICHKYIASEGTEYFISIEDIQQSILLGYLRLRIPSEPFRPEIDKNTALIRELKVVGTSVPIGEHLTKAFQHKGLGKQLMQEAEETAKNIGMEKIIVLSAIGTREYYRKLGYTQDGVYMSKFFHK